VAGFVGEFLQFPGCLLNAGHALPGLGCPGGKLPARLRACFEQTLNRRDDRVAVGELGLEVFSRFLGGLGDRAHFLYGALGCGELGLRTFQQFLDRPLPALGLIDHLLGGQELFVESALPLLAFVEQFLLELVDLSDDLRLSILDRLGLGADGLDGQRGAVFQDLGFLFV